MPLTIALRLLISSVYLFILCSTGIGQTSPGVNQAKVADGDSIESIILKIRKEYTQIVADSAKYQLASKDVMGMSTEGGELIYYHEGKLLRKASLTIFGETGRSVTEYYFADGKIFFCYERITRYDKPFYLENMHVKKVEENRYYFNDQQLIRWLDSSRKIIAGKLYAAKGKELLAEWKEANKVAE
jgi:hypothetical protein